jgi:hypothetical protein
MKNLNEIKKVLTDRAFDIYRDCMYDLELSSVDYKIHFENLAETVLAINRLNTMKDAVIALYNGTFANLGIMGEEEVAEFLTDTIYLVK